jgi:hypothetical protein
MVDVRQLREGFVRWEKRSVDWLVTELLSYEVFYEKLFTMNILNGKNVVSNFYIKVNYPMMNKFMERV